MAFIKRLKRLPPKFQLVKGTWVDATSPQGWTTPDVYQREKLIEMPFSGFLMAWTDEYIEVCATYNPMDKSAVARIAIPVGGVRSIRGV